MTDVAENTVVVPQDNHEELARTFVSVIFPRLVNELSEATHYQVNALKEMRAANQKGKQPEVVKELSAAENRLKKLLSEEVMTKVMEKMISLLKEALTPQELEYAIFQEQITIKIHGVAAQLDAAFKEAVGED